MDIGLGIFTVTPGRTEAVDYTYPLIFGNYKMYLKRPPSTDYLYFIYPFTAYTWLTIVGLLLGNNTINIEYSLSL
jgi:hypothetical protein